MGITYRVVLRNSLTNQTIRSVIMAALICFISHGPLGGDHVIRNLRNEFCQCFALDDRDISYCFDINNFVT